MTRPCIFLDRDGTLIHDPGYVHRPEDLQFLDGVPESLCALKRAGYALIMVTNQAGVARGRYPESAVGVFHAHLNRRLGEAAAIDAFYYCPYHPDGTVAEYRRDSNLRKPGIGMFQAACADHAIAVADSWMIGDKWIDVEFARAAGLRALLVRTGHGREEEQRHRASPAFEAVEVADDFPAAARRILQRGT